MTSSGKQDPLPTVVQLDWRSTAVASATDLVRRLGRSAWLPTWWPDGIGDPTFLHLEREGEPARYVVWSNRGADGLVLASSPRGAAPITSRAGEPIAGCDWPVGQAIDGSARWVVEPPGDDVLHVAGSEAASALEPLVRGLRPVDP